MARIFNIPNPLADLGDAAQIQKLDLGDGSNVPAWGDAAGVQRAMRHTTVPTPMPSYSPDQPAPAARLRPGSLASSMPIPGQKKTALEKLEEKIDSMDQNPLEAKINRIGQW